jgi:hypothetical protein
MTSQNPLQQADQKYMITLQSWPEPTPVSVGFRSTEIDVLLGFPDASGTNEIAVVDGTRKRHWDGDADVFWLRKFTDFRNVP